ncbi:cupin [Actinoplanes sp. SE50]|uniref:cupin domain-containing protein n=1 Tax=unclassified Actinoplanes TaxID=2626549 RepID=UPI00023ECE9D|nr:MULTISPECIES: cupin domain-containing protein [unclassified Actinoplanes]AEV84861.1 cupin 4 family protein [Actinoplanes sp. SE50/110]ATO83252.1 cupin [Actinoplanes sp. SE50]SLM00659.1 cupin [Actinoplanes sp. SE50/110]
MTTSALARAVGIGEAEFADTYWGKQPLLSRGRAGFTDLLSVPAVDELLSRRGLRTPFLRVAQHGKVLPAGRYTGGGGAGAEVGDQVHDERVMRLFAGGATLVLQGLHRLWPPLIEFTGRLGAELNRPLQVNAYLTPPGSQGFATHYDTHDVFVLQCEGRKRWIIHPPVLSDPIENQPWGGHADEVAATAEGTPAIDTVLEPGDALYLPRGWLHSARTEQVRSLHLTVGIRSLTRYALVEELLAMAVQEPRLRATVAYRRNPESELTATIEALREWLPTVDPAAVAARMRERTGPATRPAPLSPLAQLDFAERLTDTDEVTARPGLSVDVDGGTVRAAGYTVTFPGYCEPALRLVLDGKPHTAGDLPLDRDDSLVLIRRLLREGLLTPA